MQLRPLTPAKLVGLALALLWTIAPVTAQDDQTFKLNVNVDLTELHVTVTDDHDRLISREVVVHAERGVITDQFYAERLYSKERLAALLSRAGFSNLHVRRLCAPDSCRNQDLGMVAHRLFVTCEMPRRPRLV